MSKQPTSSYPYRKIDFEKWEKELGLNKMNPRRSMKNYLQAVRSAKKNLTMAERQAHQVVSVQKQRLLNQMNNTVKQTQDYTIDLSNYG